LFISVAGWWREATDMVLLATGINQTMCRWWDIRYYDRGPSNEGLEQPPVCQSVEGTIGCALERMGDG
jgi:hypothetical protein